MGGGGGHFFLKKEPFLVLPVFLIQCAYIGIGKELCFLLQQSHLAKSAMPFHTTCHAVSLTFSRFRCVIKTCKCIVKVKIVGGISLNSDRSFGGSEGNNGIFVDFYCVRIEIDLR